MVEAACVTAAWPGGLRLREVAVDRVHEPEREQPFPLCFERGVVLEDQFDESAAVDQPQVPARTLHM
jgi:hypothetical protein